MYHAQYFPYSQCYPQYEPQYDPQYSTQYNSQYRLQFSPQYSPEYSPPYDPQYSPQCYPQYQFQPQYSVQNSPQSSPQYSRKIEALDRLESNLDRILEKGIEKLEQIAQIKFSPPYIPLSIPQHKFQDNPPFPITELSSVCSTPVHSTAHKVEKRKHKNRKQGKEEKSSAFEPNQIVEYTLSLPPTQQIVTLEATPVQKAMEVEIQSPPIPKIVSLKAPTSHKIKEMRIQSPPVQKIVPLKAYTPHKVKEMRIASPPVQKVVLLKPFPVQRIVSTTVPSQNTPVQSVVTLQLAPVHRVVQVSVPSQNTPIQQVVSLRITPPKKLIESPVSLHIKFVSELSFFWSPEVENSNENVSSSNEMKNENEFKNENEVEVENESESELSFFWISEEVNQDVIQCAPDIVKFTSPISNPIITCRTPTVPVQNVRIVHRFSPICDAFLTILITLVYIVPPLISKTENTTSPPRQFSPQKSKVSLQTKQQFSGTCINKSRQFRSKKPSCSKENRLVPVHRTKVIPLSTRSQFSGSCVTKSRQLRSKDQLSRSKKRVSCQFATKALPYKSFPSAKDSSRSWKRRKKKRNRTSSSKSVSDQSSLLKKKVTAWKRRKKKQFLCQLSSGLKSSPLKESAAWKRRKKKKSLVASQESSHVRNGPALRRSLAWKRRKKKGRCSQWILHFVFDWDPGAVSRKNPDMSLHLFQSSVPVLFSAAFPASSLFFAKGKGMQQVDFNKNM